jgi:hypothetical protein
VKYSTTLRRVRVSVLAIAATAAILSGQFARADLIYTDIFTGSNFTIQVSNPVNIAGTALEAVTLRAVGKNGAIPNTFDSDKSGAHGTGISTTGSALHQIWPLDRSSLKTPTLDMDEEDPFNQALDSHFLVYSANLISFIAPTEDRVTNHVYDSQGGFGTYLRGTLTDMSAVSSVWDFAYLVVPGGTTVNLDFEIGADGFESDTVSRSFVVPAPEPNAIILLAVGVIGLLICRRRSAV